MGRVISTASLILIKGDYECPWKRGQSLGVNRDPRRRETGAVNELELERSAASGCSDNGDNCLSGGNDVPVGPR